MAWTCGFAIASGLDVARFYSDLLGPHKKILRQEYVDQMMQFELCDLGFDAGHLSYGGGLIVMDLNRQKEKP